MCHYHSISINYQGEIAHVQSIASEAEAVMVTKKFNSQSYRWESFVVNTPYDITLGEVFPNARLVKRKSGNTTEYTILSGGEWIAYRLNYSGRMMESTHSKNDIVFALANTGNWSGGGNYTGYIFGKPGAVVKLKRKGQEKWIVFDKDSVILHDIDPFAEGVEI